MTPTAPARVASPIELKLPAARRRASAASAAKDEAKGAIVRFWPLIRAMMCFALVALILLPELRSGFPSLSKTLGDTDDATRLVQVREFAAGAGWYDLVLARFGGADPLVSHWSRLIDAPLALILIVAEKFVMPATAELLARALWPSLLLLALLTIFAREADRRSGPIAAILAIVLAISTLNGVVMFRPGRIDHHNAMILCTLAGLLLFARATKFPRCGWYAGFAFGLALTIGYEPLAFIVPIVCLASSAALIDGRHMPGVKPTVSSFAATLVLGLVLSQPPMLWHLAPCDAIGANLVVLAASGALALYAADRLAVRNLVRVIVAAAIVAAGAGLAYAINPACAAGPFAAVSAEAKQIWLANVVDNTPFHEMLGLNPVPMLAFAVTALLGLAAAWHRWRLERSPDAALLCIGLVFMTMLALTMMKYIAYAALLSSFCLALGLAAVKDRPGLSAGTQRILAVVSLNQLAIAIMATILGIGTTATLSDATDHAACTARETIAALAPLPKGFVVAPIDLGPAIVADTAHDVLAAPYHRIHSAIVANARIFESTPAEAERTLTTIGATYVVTCRTGRNDVARKVPDSLAAHLASSSPPSFLEPLHAARAPLGIWRVKP